MKKSPKIWLLVFLFTCITITGISYIDDLIVDRIIAALGAISFSAVGFLYRAGAIHGKREGSDAFKVIFGCLLIIVFLIYLGIRKFQEWVVSWPVYVKILVPCLMGMIIFSIVLSLIVDSIKNKKKNNEN